MRCHHNVFPSLDGRRHGLVPKRNDALHGVFQAFREGNVLGLQFGVAQVGAFTPGVGRFKGRRGRVIAATPDQNLRIAKLLSGFGFVQALKGAVMAFVQAPAVVHWQPLPVHGI